MLKDSDLDILNGTNVNWVGQKQYIGALTFCFACCDYFSNIGDMKFLNNIPMDMDEFHQKPIHVKDKYVNIMKSHIYHFNNMDEEQKKSLQKSYAAKNLNEQYQTSLKILAEDYDNTIKEIKGWMSVSFNAKYQSDDSKKNNHKING